MLDRESIYAALFAQLKAKLLDPVGPIKTMDRRYRAVGTLAPPQYPALMLVERGELYTRGQNYGMPPKVSLYAHAVIQNNDGENPSTVTATALNELADAVEQAVIWTGDQAKPALFNLVRIAWVNGREVQYIAQGQEIFSVQDIEIEMIWPA